MEGGQYHQPAAQIARFADWGGVLSFQNSSVHAELLAAWRPYGERLLRHSQIGSEPERLRIQVS